MKNLIVILALLGFNVCFGQPVTIRGRIVDGQRQAIPFANVALFRASDTLTLVSGTASDLDGRYSVETPEPGEYRLRVSFLGYRSVSLALHAGEDLVQDLLLEADPTAIGEVVVEGKRTVRSIDKTSYLFTKEQVEKASDGRELVATLPNLRVDRTTNALATINGKSVLILINGIKATDEELRLIPADKVRGVELYDVPPIRYMDDAEQVVNIRTRPLDTGWSGNLYGTLGQMFSNGSVALSYIKGDNRLTFNYGAHINMKRDKTDLESIIVEPPEAIRTYSYRCSSNFELEPLKAMLDDKFVYGLLVIDRREAYWGFLRGTHIEPINGTTSTVPGKQRKGGQSSIRFERLRLIAIHEFYKKVGERASEAFLAEPNFFEKFKGVLIGGPMPTKEEFAEGDFLHHEVKKRIIGLFQRAHQREWMCSIW